MTTTTTVAADGTKTVTTTTTWVNFSEGKFISSTQRINVDEFDSKGKKVASMGTGLAPERLDEDGAKAVLRAGAYKQEQINSIPSKATKVLTRYHKVITGLTVDGAIAATGVGPEYEGVKKVVEVLSGLNTAWEVWEAAHSHN
jgi:hypothetical protein